jgi:Ca-activated chloride channel family protein
MKIDSVVSSMQADFSTALYDGILAGLDQLGIASGVNILVVLTDGHDNSSGSTWNDVIEMGVAAEVPIYIIGLGDVNEDTLRTIANSTKGQFYRTKSPSSLDSIYAEISKKIQAFYDLTYESSNFSSADTIRKIELSFDIDSIYLINDPTDLKIPKEVVTMLSQKEKEKDHIRYGVLATVSLLGLGVLLLYFRKKRKNKRSLIIHKLYPNPTNGEINLDFSGNADQLNVINIEGRTEKVVSIDPASNHFDLSDLPDGVFIAILQKGSDTSNSVKFIVKH